MRFWLIMIPQMVYFEKQISTREVLLGKTRYSRWRSNWPPQMERFANLVRGFVDLKKNQKSEKNSDWPEHRHPPPYFF